MKTVEKQVEDQRQKLYVTKTNLATEKQAVLDLKAALQKAQEEARLAKEAIQLVKEVAEAEKRAAYQLGRRRLRQDSLRSCQRYAGITVAFHGLRLLI